MGEPFVRRETLVESRIQTAGHPKKFDFRLQIGEKRFSFLRSAAIRGIDFRFALNNERLLLKEERK